MTLLAVHIADGVLAWPWWTAGWVLLAGLLGLGARRLRDEEVAPLALLAAAFFVSSLIHVKLPGTSVHLLLNALVGMVLGLRAVLALLLGLFLQALLFSHGGLVSLGVNACILTLPAFLARGLLLLGDRADWLEKPGRRRALGFAIGFLAVLATLLLHFLVLAFGSIAGEDLRKLAAFDFLFHLPILGLESLITMTALDFLWRVKPEALGLPSKRASSPPETAGTSPAAPNGERHALLP